ncbi:hypothetical protein PDJAM_G00083180 [Pangasius djambal]|uniref:Uncharacterized protein n=1 Tax=Pangasius djambal TaxID=1691987 RepID=A0ACC5Z371_9TELE|nr:hypothetical protein [Pangasius djambal]
MQQAGSVCMWTKTTSLWSSALNVQRVQAHHLKCAWSAMWGDLDLRASMTTRTYVDLLWGKLKKRDQQLATWPGKLKKVVQEAV